MENALEGAGLVTLATKAASPILTSEHLRPGMHVNSVGPASRDRVEVDPAIFGSFDRVVCDSARLVLDEAGDAHQAVSAHDFDPTRAEDLGDLVTGAALGTGIGMVAGGSFGQVVGAGLIGGAAGYIGGTAIGNRN